jgi:hypothetical protein
MGSGGKVVFSLVGDEIKVTSVRRGIERTQATSRQYAANPMSVDGFIASRRAESAREMKSDNGFRRLRCFRYMALLNNGAGADMVADYIEDGILSVGNFQEVVKTLLQQGVPSGAALASSRICIWTLCRIVTKMPLTLRPCLTVVAWAIVRAWHLPPRVSCPFSRPIGRGPRST